MKLAELGVAVDMISLVPVKRSHSVCAQVESTAAMTRRDNWAMNGSADDDYGGDFLNHQPPVKEMATGHLA